MDFLAKLERDVPPTSCQKDRIYHRYHFSPLCSLHIVALLPFSARVLQQGSLIHSPCGKQLNWSDC